MMKKKILSALTALCCAVGCMGTTAFAEALTLNAGSTVMVIASGEDGYLMSNGSVIANTYMTTYLSTDSDLPVCGDVLSLTGCSIEPMEVGRYTFDEDGSITNLGAAEDCWTGREELTVTEKKDGEALVSYTFCDAAGTEYAVTRFVWNAVYHESMGYTFTDSVGFESLTVGETYEFVMDDEGDPVLPVAVNGETTLPSEEFIVVGVDDAEQPENYIICDADGNATYYLTEEMLTQYLSEDESTPAFGDILTLEGEIYATVLDATNEIGFLDEQGTISIADSIFNYDETAEFSVTSINDRKIMLLKDDIEYSRYIDFTESYIQPGCVDWSTVETGDSVTCITYNGVPVLPVAVNAETARPSQEFIVIGVDNAENPQNFIIQGVDAYSEFPLYLPLSYAQRFLPEGEPPIKFGDILLLEGGMMSTDLGGINTFNFVDDEGNDSDDAGCIYNLGSVLDYPTKIYTASIPDAVFRNISLGDSHLFVGYPDNYVQPGCIDWDSVADGDKVECITYMGQPLLPIFVTRLGDFNADGTLSVVDAILVNKHAMNILPTGDTFNYTAADFNGDGSIDFDDSLNILRRLIGLA